MTTLSDGGIISANRACRSGLCVNDPLIISPPTNPYFCFGACAVDGDCGDAGVCDADFLVNTPGTATPGFVRGCRPRCDDERQCTGYDAGVTCRVRVLASASTPQFSATCSPTTGLLPTGATCTVNGQCRSAFCQFDDTRGVRRSGVCVAPCIDSDTCAVDAGLLLPQTCQPTAVLVSRGFDGLAPSADDRFITSRLCSGIPCIDDTTCSADGGAVCVPQASASMPLGELALRCQPLTTGLLRGGDACVIDTQCRSGLCGGLQAPSTGSGRACFEACTATSVCPGTTSCRVGGLSVAVSTGSVSVDSCAP